jgi:hypothetical protein
VIRQNRSFADAGGHVGKLIIGIIIGVVIVLWALFSILGWIF